MQLWLSQKHFAHEEQLEILRKRGLTIPDESLALRWLKEKNYYRLSAYSLNLRKDEPFVLHHHNDPNDVYPLWVIAEVLSFDQVSMMYRNLLPNDRSAIAREYYGISAHGARFYHRQRVNPPAKLPKSINQYGTKPFGYVYAIHHLLPPSERALFVDSVQSCFDSHPSAKLSELGFPVNWKEILSEY